jgi:hypothetical protein
VSNRLGSIAVAVIGVCHWIFAFLFSVCVLMSNDAHSPAIQMSVATESDAVRTIILLLLVILSWIASFAFVGKMQWAWFYTWLLGITLIAIGLCGYWTGGGPLAAITEGALLHDTGYVLAAAAAGALILLNLPPTRRAFFGA